MINKFLTRSNAFLLTGILVTFLLAWLIDKNVGRGDSESLKVWLALASVILVLIWTKLNEKVALTILSLLIVVSVLNYMRWGTTLLSKRVDSYDLIHYYLGAKYFKELGYYDLYPAAILADSENIPFSDTLIGYRAQDKQYGYVARSLSHGIARGKKVRSEQFTRQRWQEFEKDFLHIQREFNLNAKLWRTLMNDRGFNATPAWIYLMRPIAEMVPVEQIKWLCIVDLLFIAIGLLFIRWAFGNMPALWGLLFFAISYSVRWPVISWAFFRYDWICALMVAFALIKRKQHLFAGILTGLASLYRFFPAIWMFGPASKGLYKFITGGNWQQRFDKNLLILAAGFLATVILIETVTVATMGTEVVKIHAENISEHTQTEELSSRRLGFALALSYNGKLWPQFISEERKQLIKTQKPLRLFLSIVMLIALAWFLRHKDDDEAFAYGFIPFFILSTASYYYAVTRVILIIFHASKIQHTHHRVGLAILLSLEVFSNWAATVYSDHRVFMIGYLAWGLTAYILYMLWNLYSESKNYPQHS